MSSEGITQPARPHLHQSPCLNDRPRVMRSDRTVHHILVSYDEVKTGATCFLCVMADVATLAAPQLS